MKIMDLYISFISLTAVLFTGFCEGLKCWHCVADNCDEDPRNNYKASEKTCLQGQICQKVYFEMYSAIDRVKYKSLVRSCAEECTTNSDDYNCTNDLFITRGCIKRSCCDDEDLCNHATHQVYSIILIISVALLARLMMQIAR